MINSLKSATFIGVLLLLNITVANSQTILTFKHYTSSVSFYERDLDTWFNTLLNENTTLSKDRKLSYEEYTNFKISIIQAMKNKAYFEVDNLRYMKIPNELGYDYFLQKDSDKYKATLKKAKQVGKKDWFVDVMKIRQAFLGELTDLVIENGKKIPSN